MVTPFIGTDKRLRDTVDSVNEALKTPSLQAASGVAEKLTTLVKEAYGQTGVRTPRTGAGPRFQPRVRQ